MLKRIGSGVDPSSILAFTEHQKLKLESVLVLSS